MTDSLSDYLYFADEKALIEHWIKALEEQETRHHQLKADLLRILGRSDSEQSKTRLETSTRLTERLADFNRLRTRLLSKNHGQGITWAPHMNWLLACIAFLINALRPESMHFLLMSSVTFESHGSRLRKALCYKPYAQDIRIPRAEKLRHDFIDKTLITTIYQVRHQMDVTIYQGYLNALYTLNADLTAETFWELYHSEDNTFIATPIDFFTLDYLKKYLISTFASDTTTLSNIDKDPAILVNEYSSLLFVISEGLKNKGIVTDLIHQKKHICVANMDLPVQEIDNLEIQDGLLTLISWGIMERLALHCASTPNDDTFRSAHPGYRLIHNLAKKTNGYQRSFSLEGEYHDRLNIKSVHDLLQRESTTAYIPSEYKKVESITLNLLLASHDLELFNEAINKYETPDGTSNITPDECHYIRHRLSEYNRDIFLDGRNSLTQSSNAQEADVASSIQNYSCA